MSVRVMTWVWEHSPTAGNELLMLLAIADCADDHGTNAWPSVPTLAVKTRLDIRTVQRITRRLEAAGHLLVTPSAGRRNTNLYTVVLTTAHHTCTAPGGLPADRHPRQTARVAQAPPLPRQRAGGPPALVPPEPSRTVPEPSSPAPARTYEAALGDGGGGESRDGNDPAGVLDGLGSAWRLTRGQRERLVPLVAGALAEGWTPGALGRVLGENPEGVRAPFAVLRTRLSDLPAPPSTPTNVRPVWCGDCDEATRLVERPDGAYARCGACHPLNAPQKRSEPVSRPGSASA
ncbi:MAG: helix-turn-helix domain-containing protein [Carbonactinosporaceae bacterium]